MLQCQKRLQRILQTQDALQVDERMHVKFGVRFGHDHASFHLPVRRPGFAVCAAVAFDIAA